MAEDDVSTVSVRFVSRLPEPVELPESAFAVPESLTRKGLAEVINGLLQLDPPQPFDFLINENFLRCSLATFLKNRHLSKELTVRIDVVRPFNKPTPEPLPEFDDWVGCIGVGGVDGLVAAGLYNGAVCLSHIPTSEVSADQSQGEQLVSPSVHKAPIKGIAHVAAGVGRHWLVSASKDCTLRTWEYAKGDGAPSCTAICSGHTDAVDCVQACPSMGQGIALFGSGSWDKTVKLWDAPLVSKQNGPELPELLPKASLDGHTQAVSCLCWRQAETLYSGSYDHTIRVWDTATASASRTIYGSKRVISCLDYSVAAQRIATGHQDRRVRLWDPRAPETAMEGQTLGGSTGAHTGWITGIAWSPKSAFHLFSCALDGEAKVWDVRASVPLHTLKAHDDKALCAAWVDEHTMATGGADRKVVFHQV